MLLTRMLEAQVETAVELLKISPSPMLNGMGAVGTALPSDDEFAIYYNPAQLAYSSTVRSAAAQFFPINVKLTDQSKPAFKASSANIGFRMGGRSMRTPIILGLGYISAELDRGTVVFEDPPGNEIERMLSNDYYDAFSVAIGFSYFITLNAGFTYKRISTQTSYFRFPDLSYERLNDKLGAVDYGFLLIVPILRRYKPGPFREERKMTKYQPYLDLSIGYSKANIGDEVNYSNRLPASPLPRSGRLGYGVSLGVYTKIKQTVIQLGSLDWSVQANDLLVEGSNENFSYQSFIGDISIGRNILQAKGDAKVESHLGYSIELGETLRYSGGYYEGGGMPYSKTSGFAIRTKGLFKLLKQRYTKTWYSFIVDKMDIRYFNSTYYIYNDHKSRFQGISLVLSAF